MDKRSLELLEKERAIKQLYEFIAEQVIAGLFKNDIIEKVIELGYDKYTAADLVDEIESRMRRIRRKSILLLMPQSRKNDKIGDAFKCSGFETHHFISGEGFLENIKEIVPDLVIIEHVPSVIDGHKLISSLRRHPVGRRIPVFIIAGRKQLKDAFESLENAEFILKSFEVGEMLKKAKKLFIIKRVSKISDS